MEMVKVDVQKLQLLNDRITQMIDALNQVRLSVQGIQHTGAPWAASPYGSYGLPYGVQPTYGVPYGAWNADPYVPSPYPGIQHTPTFTTGVRTSGTASGTASGTTASGTPASRTRARGSRPGKPGRPACPGLRRGCERRRQCQP